MIENRNLLAGTRLVANYKKQTLRLHRGGRREWRGCGLRPRRRLPTQEPVRSGLKVMGGKAVNGWRFWSLEDDAPAAAEPKPDAEPRKKGKARKLIYRVPNQQGTPEGRTKFFCTACMKGFLVDAGEQPKVCPEGHRTDDPELTAPTGETAAQ